MNNQWIKSLIRCNCATTNVTKPIELTTGNVIGKWLQPRSIKPESINKYFPNSQYASFLGIPFGSTPGGCHRFQSPLPPNKWTGVLEAFGQVYEGLKEEDQHLTLNVYTPKLPNESSTSESDLMPVMAVIPGSSFSDNTNEINKFGPDFMVQQNIVIVKINYRLGALGFLSTNDEKAPGNAGLKDQVLALKWIQENIKQFNGNPNQVTLVGESEGAACAHLHLLSPSSVGLFHKAILQSGCCLNSWALRPAQEVAEFSFELGRRLGIQTRNSYSLLKNIQFVQLETFMKQANTINNLTILPPFLPVVEDEDSSSNPFITKNPVNMIRNGEFSKVPIIIGYNNSEGMVLGPLLSEIFRQPIRIPRVFKIIVRDYAIPALNGNLCDFKDIEYDIRQFYFGTNIPKRGMLPEFVDFVSDACFLYGLIKSVILHRNFQDLYLYQFDFNGKFNFRSIETNHLIKNMGHNPLPGTSHGDELSYLWKSLPDGLLEYPSTEVESSERQTLERMIRMWASFVKYGAPIRTCEDDSFQNSEWPPVTLKEQGIPYLSIGNELSTIRNKIPFQERMEYWLKLQERYGKDGKVLHVPKYSVSNNNDNVDPIFLTTKEVLDLDTITQ